MYTWDGRERGWLPEWCSGRSPWFGGEIDEGVWSADLPCLVCGRVIRGEKNFDQFARELKGVEEDGSVP